MIAIILGIPAILSGLVDINNYAQLTKIAAYFSCIYCATISIFILTKKQLWNNLEYILLGLLGILLGVGTGVLLGMVVTKFFVYMINTKFYLKHGSKRQQFIYQIAVLPWFVASVICSAFYLPKINPFILCILVSNGIVILVVFLFVRIKKFKRVRIYKMESITRVSLNIVYVLIIIYIIFQKIFDFLQLIPLQ